MKKVGLNGCGKISNGQIVAFEAIDDVEDSSQAFVKMKTE